MANQLNEEGLKLTSQEKMSLGLDALNDFFSLGIELTGGYMQAYSYNFQAWQNSINADLLRQDARNILTEANEYENQVREQGAKVRGEQIAAMSASGFDVDSESYKGIIAETDRNIARNAQAIRTQALSKYSAVMAQAGLEDVQSDYYRSAAKMSKRQGITNAIYTGLTGAVKYGALKYFS